MSARDNSKRRPTGRLIDLVSNHHRRFARFGLVGISGVLVNFALLVAGVELLGLHHLLAGAIATEAAICNNFLFNDIWTFREVHRSHSWFARFVRFHSVALGGLVISVATLGLLVDGFGVPYLAANVAGIGAAVVWNYGGNSLVTWSRPDARSPGKRIAGAWRGLVRRAAVQISKVLG